MMLASGSCRQSWEKRRNSFSNTSGPRRAYKRPAEAKHGRSDSGAGTPTTKRIELVTSPPGPDAVAKGATVREQDQACSYIGL